MSRRRRSGIKAGAALVAGAASALLLGAGVTPSPGAVTEVSSEHPKAGGPIGAVTAGGAPDTFATGLPAAGWGVVRVGPGDYRVTIGDAGGPEPTLEVEAWDAPAVATVTPGRDGQVEVTFERDGRPVDTRFSFRLGPPG
jgi:hypothetical protein